MDSLARGIMNARTFEEVDLVHEQFDTHYFSFARIYNEQQLLSSRSYTHSFSFQCFQTPRNVEAKRMHKGETSENIK